MDHLFKKMDKDFDVIIIGTGVGGGTFADYLTREDQKLKVVILEAGPYFERSYFNQNELDMTALYIGRGSVLSDDLEIGVSAASMVGGSSAVYTGVSFRPPKSILDSWRKDFGIDFLEDAYVSSSLDEIEEDISVHELPESWDNQNNQLFAKGAKNLGLKVKRLKINTLDCKQQGFCNLGCTSGAKQGTLEVQIPRVIERGVDLIANATVNRIEENKVFFSLNNAPEGSRKNNYESGQYEINAKYIVLAAGVLNTPAILLRSQSKLSINKENIGRYLTLHPAMNVNGVYKERIDSYKGFPKTVYVDQFSESHHFYIETSFYYPGISAKNNPGYGKLHREFMKDYSKMMSILILIHDKAERHNRISIDKNGKTKIIYKLNPETKKSLVKALQVSTKLFFEAGCIKALVPGSNKMPLLAEDKDNLEKYITSKDLRFSLTPMSSAHPQGGARMGADPATSVCDTKGKVHGSESIYVCDASLFPSSVNVNPYETIMLFAKYIAEEMNKEIKRSTN